MEKVGRNEPCPCGSGKKFKFCHGKRTLPPKENVAAILLDDYSKKALLVTKEILVNQIHREAPAIAKSFDRLTENDIRAISAILAEAMGIIFPHVIAGQRRLQTDVCAIAGRGRLHSGIRSIAEPTPKWHS